MIDMTKTILRHPAGTPASQGGEFKTHDRAEADISLDPAIAAAATLSQAALLDAAANGQMLSYGEPETSWGRNNITEGSRTPWGEADYVTNIADGITSVSTPGHGGVKLSAQRNRVVHPALRVKGGWYEEDCEQAIVAFTFPKETRIRKALGYGIDRPLDDHIADSDERVRNWFPDGWEAATGKTLEPGQSRERDSANWLAAHADAYIVTSAITDDNDPARVIVTATHGDDKQRFIVPKDEYSNARETPELGQGGRFAIDTTRHEQLPEQPRPARVPAKKYTSVYTVGMTPAAAARVEKDLRQRWRSDDGRVRTLGTIIGEGITGKGATVENGKRSYHLSQQDYEGGSGGHAYTVSKATWVAVDAPDDRSARQRAYQELELAEHADEKASGRFGSSRGFGSGGRGLAVGEALKTSSKLMEAKAAYDAAILAEGQAVRE